MLKMLTDIGWSSACDTFIAERVYFVLIVGLEVSGEIETDE